MRRTLNGLLLIAFMTTALTAFGADDPPPPPPPPPPPLEETGPVIEEPTSGSWSIKGPDGLLDKSTGHVRHPMLSFFIGVPFVNTYGYTYTYYGAFSVGLGLRFYIPLFKEGFLPMLNDSFGIEFGFDSSLVFGSYLGLAMGIPAEVRWNFHIFPKLEAYAKVGLGLGILVVGSTYFYPIPIANVGVLFRVNKVLSLRAEVGSPAVKIGLGLAF